MGPEKSAAGINQNHSTKEPMLQTFGSHNCLYHQNWSFSLLHILNPADLVAFLEDSCMYVCVPLIQSQKNESCNNSHWNLSLP